MFAIVVVIAFALVLSYSYFLERTPQRGIQTVTSTITKAFTIVSRTMVTGPPNQTKAAGFDAVAIYIEANASVVTVSGSTSSGLVVGSGFVTAYQNSTYILTNFHVVDSVSDITVTFWDGNSYPARMIASDPYSDLAILTTEAPHFEFPHPLSLYPSSFLNVGQTVVAIGAPFGLSGSMTVGIISQLGRTLQDPTAGNFSIAAVIQFSAPINPGNSGGPLLDSNGDVVGITTAVVQS
ncbi:MAG TPA: trypsin-like peptidase domain-containing protein, partial [Nitrososphaerales archaeon]|nr:trypsin-like peptidase domain-containing protein [Nitrososphaerales archaeon]